MGTTGRWTRSVLGGLFVLSGFVGVAAEQVFEKLLGLLLGTSTPAAAIVLGVYFAGLTAGAVGYARFLRDRVRSPLRAYALLEGGVGAWCLLWALLFDRLMPAFAVLLRPAADTPWMLNLLRIGVASAWILPPTMLMGATFPAIADALETLEAPDGRRSLARFYAANLLGGLAAALAAPYLLFPAAGMDGALGACFLLDAAACGVALRLASANPVPDHVAERRTRAAPPERAGLLLSLAAVSGFLFFALEVLWTHLIGAVLGNSVYAFAAMLTVVLSGLAIGGAAMGLLIRRDRPLPDVVPAVLFLLGAAALVVTHGRWPLAPHALAVRGAGVTTFFGGEALRLLEAAALMLAPATVLGMAYPSLFRLESFPSGGWGGFVGRMGAMNTIGCVAGAFAGAFVLLPRIGSEAALLLVMDLYALVALGAGLVLARGRARAVFLVAALGVVGAGGALGPWNQLALTSGEHVYFQPEFVQPSSRLRFFHEDPAGGITTVVENPSKGGPLRVLLTNGKFQGNDGGEVAAQTAFALVPALSISRRDRALVIGLGTGQTAHVVSTLGFREEDVVEIAPGIVAASRSEFAHVTGNVLERPGVRLRLEDGRNFLLLHGQRYDFVSMEISSIWFAGATNLYSREFYELVRSRLAPGGVFQQWIQLHHLGSFELVSVIATLRSVFPHVSVWVLGGQGILVGSVGPQDLTAEGLRAVTSGVASLGWPPEEVGTRLGVVLAGRVLAPDETDGMLRRLAAKINTDRNRWLEFASPRFNLSRVPWEVVNVGRLVAFAGPPRFTLGPGVPPELAAVPPGVSADQRLRQLGLTSELVAGIRKSLDLPPGGPPAP